MRQSRHGNGMEGPITQDKQHNSPNRAISREISREYFIPEARWVNKPCLIPLFQASRLCLYLLSHVQLATEGA